MATFYPKYLENLKKRSGLYFLVYYGCIIANALRLVPFQHTFFTYPPTRDALINGVRTIMAEYNFLKGASPEEEAFPAEQVRFFPMNEVEQDALGQGPIRDDLVRQGRAEGLLPLWEALIGRWMDDGF
jgi:hypothetical protein